MYINSNNIKVYPTASRELSIDYGANINLEQNIVGLSNNITDYNSYKVSGLDIIVDTSDTTPKLKLTSGKCVLHGYSVEIINNTELDSALLGAGEYFVIISLDTTSTIINNTQIEYINGTDNSNVYTPITVTISDELITSSNYDLLLGKVTYDGSNWSVNFNTISRKFKSDNIQINLPNNSGLVKNNQVYEGSFSNWLRDSFIFDDGDLSDYTQSIDEIFVEYTNGITLNIPTSELSTTFNGNMIPSVSDVKCLAIPTYFTEIVQGALAGASNLEELTIPFVGDSIKTAEDTYQYPFGYIFGTSIYSGATATAQLYRGSSIETQDMATYYVPDTLSKVTILQGNILLGAFSNCENITIINLPKLITKIDTVAFFNDVSLSNLEIPPTVTSIGGTAFRNCSSLTNITVPNSVTSIGGLAFGDCHSLINITLPANVTNIGNATFLNCDGLVSITFLATTPPTIGENVFDYTNNCPIYVPTESVSVYQTAPNWSVYSDRIQPIQE